LENSANVNVASEDVILVHVQGLGSPASSYGKS
jgi:hypothetical protein